MINTDVNINTYRFDGLELLSFEYIHVPTGLPTNHPARELYDNRIYQENTDPNTDIHWINCKDEQERQIGHAEFGTSKGRLICLNIQVELEHVRSS